MSLFRQQLLWITALFSAALFISVCLFGVNTHKLLQEQHQNQLNHTSNQLAWMLKAQYRIKAPTLFESELTEYLDPDHYTHVRLDDLTTNTHQEIVRKNNPITLVPNWFLDLKLLPTLKEQRVIYHNWKKVANFTLERQPYLEYQALWRFFYQSTFAMIVSLLLFTITLSVLLKRQLFPLEKLSTRCGQALKQSQFLHLPAFSTPELRNIVKLINELSQNVHHHIKVQQQETARIQSETYRDAQTGLSNKIFFKEQVQLWLEESHRGGLILIRTDLLDKGIQHLSFEEKDRVIGELCEVLEQATQQEDALLARINANELSILIRQISEEKLRTLGDLMKNMLKNLHRQYDNLSHGEYSLVLLHNETPANYNALFSRLDDAMSNLKRTSADNLFFLCDEDKQGRVRQRTEWKTLLEVALTRKNFNHRTQPVFENNGQPHHIELFTTVEIEGQDHPPSKFLGKIEELDMSNQFDRYVIEYAINHIQSQELAIPLAVNITDNSIKDPAFINWLNRILSKNPQLREKLYFEIPESVYRLSPEATHLFCDNLKRQDFIFGIDNYGRYDNVNWDYIQIIRPNYVKIDRIYTDELNDKLRSQTLSSLCRTAHALNILTIATCVETETQKERLSDLFVDACQGYIHKQPQSI